MSQEALTEPIVPGGAGLMTAGDNVIRAFSVDHVIRLTGLSKGQLVYWDRTDFFRPQYAFENRRSPYSRIYSFRDVVGLRTLAILRKKHGVSLQHLREVAAKLSHLKEALWAKTTLYVHNKEVHFEEPETGKIRGIVSGQYISIPLAEIMDDITQKVKRLKERAATKRGKVERHRHIARNAWVIAGTRIPASAIAQFKEAGYSYEEIMREYPSLTAADIEAALKHQEALAKRA
jgi:DNA-binding transcriptional MerR regulator